VFGKKGGKHKPRWISDKAISDVAVSMMQRFASFQLVIDHDVTTGSHIKQEI